MLQLQKVSSIIGRRNPLPPATFISSNRLHQAQRLRNSQTSESDKHQLEWDRARPFNEIPTWSAFSMFLSFLPGGKYSKLSHTKLFKLMYKEYGQIFRIPPTFGNIPMILSFNPEDFPKVFRAEGVWPERRPLAILNLYRSKLRADLYQGVEGLVQTNGEKWAKFRSAVNPILMNPRTIKSYIPKMSKVNLEFIQRIKEIRDPHTLEVPDNFEDELNRYTLETVSVVALDQQLGAMRARQDDPEVKKLFTDMKGFLRLTYELELEPSMWKIFPTPKYRQIIAALDGINDFVVKYVNKASDRLDKSPSNVPEAEKGVLEKLLKIDKKIATIMAMDMIMFGVDTTSSSLTSVFLCLAKNPEKQQKLRDYLLQVLPEKDTPFNEEILSKMSYLRACIKESMRIYPLLPGNNRLTGKDLVLSGYRIPKGTQLSMADMMAKDDPTYFVEPKKFIPERWLRRDTTGKGDDIVEFNTINPFVFLPFGFGPRMCVGRRLADLEMEITVARLIRNFNLEFNYSTENAFKSCTINLPAIPLRFKFTDI